MTSARKARDRLGYRLQPCAGLPAIHLAVGPLTVGSRFSVLVPHVFFSSFPISHFHIPISPFLFLVEPRPHEEVGTHHVRYHALGNLHIHELNSNGDFVQGRRTSVSWRKMD